MGPPPRTTTREPRRDPTASDVVDRDGDRFDERGEAQVGAVGQPDERLRRNVPEGLERTR